MIEIIVIDDDPEIIKLFKLHFNSEINTHFTYIGDYMEGLATIASKSFDLYIVDYILGNEDGLKLINILQKEKNIENRVVLMSSELPRDKRVEAFDLGVSNIIDKPLDYKILRAIINKNIRMVSGQRKEVLRMGDVEINTNSYECFTGEGDQKKEVQLTLTEFKFLRKLIESNTRVVQKTELSFLGRDPHSPMGFKSLEMKIVALRKKLGEAGKSITTVRGLGYRFIP